MRVSIIVPIYNALKDLKVLIKSLKKNVDWQNSEVLLINDASDEETSEYLEKFCKTNSNFKLLVNEANLGFIKTCNRGIKASSGDIVVLLNSDTKIPPEFCQRIVKCFNSSENIGVASPISSHSLTYYITLPKNYTIEKMNKRLQKRHKCTYPRVVSPEGYCFCIRKKVIEQQGYLDEIFGKGYHEEVDFSYRAAQNGWINVLIDDLYVYHKRHASFGKEQREKLIAENNKIFRDRWKNFAREYNEKNKLVNPINKIRDEVFPMQNFFDTIIPKLKKTYLVFKF